MNAATDMRSDEKYYLSLPVTKRRFLRRSSIPLDDNNNRVDNNTEDSSVEGKSCCTSTQHDHKYKYCPVCAHPGKVSNFTLIDDL